MIAPFLAHFVYKDERLDRIKTLGISISVIGVLLIFNSSPNVAVENRYLGNFLILGASVSWSIYTVFSKTILKEIPPLTYQFWSLVSGWIMLAILMVAEQSNQRSPPISFSTVWRLAYLGIFAAGIAYSLYNVSIKHIGPTRTAVIINFAPLFGIFFSVVFAQEEFSLIYPIAFATIFAGIYLVNKNS